MTAARSSRGFALLWAMALVVMVGGLSAVVVARLTTMRQSAAADEADVAAVLAADGAIATARATLASDPSWAGGRVDVGAVPVATSVVRGTHVIVVTARAGGSVVLEATLRPDGDRPPRIATWRRVR